ncbi:MAG: M48 family metalloprotease [Armatimonadetes bacterium]|nr:M48 family metalloprotease [Armatimonadota bacterium]MDE2206561.1 M48 family metalloprotease [Armatimonadota bacterium]
MKRLATCAAAMAVVWLAVGVPCRAQVRRGAFLRVGLDRSGDITGTLYLPRQPEHPRQVLADLSAAVGVPLAGIVTWQNEYWVLQGRCVDGAHRSGLVRRCFIHPRALLTALHATSATSLQLSVIYRGTPHIRFSLPPDHAAPPLEGYARLVWATIPAGALPAVITVAYGYNAVQALTVLAPYLVILLLIAIAPMAALILARRRNTPEAAFSALLAETFAVSVFSFVWLALWLAGGGGPLIQFGTESGVDRVGIGAIGWCMIVPLVLIFTWRAWCVYPLARPQFQPSCSRLRFTLYTFLRTGVWFTTLLCGVQATLGLFGESPTVFIRWLAAAALASLFGGISLHRMRPAVVYDLAETELGARIGELAAAAGTPLRRAVLLWSTISRMANATASERGVVSITAPLLTALDRAQVDAVVQHELGHTRFRDGRSLRVSMAVAAAVVLGTAVLVRSSLSALPVLMLAPLIAITVACLLLQRAFARQLEYRADRSAALDADGARDLIAALVVIHRFNSLPLEWSRASALLTTHPTTMARIRTMAARSGIPASDVEALVAGAESGGDHYSGPPTTAPNTSRAKFACSDAQASAGIVSALMAALPAALLARFAVASPPGYGIVVAACAATVAVLLVAELRVSAACYHGLLRWYWRRCGAQAVLLCRSTARAESAPVDIGRATVVHGDLAFAGVDYAFTLKGEQVDSVVSMAGSWYGWPIDVLAVVWRVPGADSNCKLLLCRSRDAAAKTSSATSLAEWLEAGATAPDASTAEPPRWSRDLTRPGNSSLLLPVVGFTALFGLLMHTPVQAVDRMSAVSAISASGAGVLIATVLRRVWARRKAAG